MDGIGSLKHSHTRAPLCGANKKEKSLLKSTSKKGAGQVGKGKEGGLAEGLVVTYGCRLRQKQGAAVGAMGALGKRNHSHKQRQHPDLLQKWFNLQRPDF